jgi:aryl-alcohol dehydrogenase-like predicted oxidoreductase
MKNARLGGLEVSRIGLGAMTMAGTYTSEGALDNAESIRTIYRALDLGVTHIDTAEIYGPFLSEEIVKLGSVTDVLIQNCHPCPETSQHRIGSDRT